VLSFGVLLGFSAFVVDLGRGHLEHRTVQNAADESARGLAQQCAEAGPGCTTAVAAKTQATTLSGLNSFDGVTTVTAVCGGGVLGTCATPPTGTLECKTVPSKYAASYVRVTTTTKTSDGKSAIPPIFAFNGNDMKSDACAQVVWGKAASAEVEFPFALPICRFDLSGTPVIHDFVSNDPLESCTINTLEGSKTYNQVIKGFSYVRIPGVTDACTEKYTISTGQILDREPSTAQLCGAKLETKLAEHVGLPMWLPVVTTLYCNGGTIDYCKTGQGSFQYQVASFVRYTMTGFKLQSREGGTPPPGGWKSMNCTSNGACITGTFSRGVSPTSTISDDPSIPSLGLFAVQQIP